MLKAAREAKRFTSWMDPDPAFEAALAVFIEKVLGYKHFTADLSAFLEPLSWPAMVTSLSQTLIQCTAPGVPDIYQGTELWDRHLADPDNRRPVDFQLRQRYLKEIEQLPVAGILSRYPEGMPKLFLLQRVLSARRRWTDVFGPKGDYRPLRASGERAGDLVAFIRGGRAVTLAPIRGIGSNGDWRDTGIDLPAGRWENLFGGDRFEGGTLELSRIFASFPVALLIKH
jgi:(1->4)-alpha-D-glucan 1-alpha-D-glucosylmutase